MKKLPYVSEIGFLGHSQGGVIASMTAGLLAEKGPVLVLHGTKDSIVPMWCSEKYKETYGDTAKLTVIDGENHTITRRRNEVVRQIVEFFR